MTALLARLVQLRATRDTLVRLDPQAAAAIDAHLATLSDAVETLRECGIQIAALQTLQEAAGEPVGFLRSLRARIDDLTGAVPAPQRTSAPGA